MMNLNDIAEQARMLAKRRGFSTDVLSTLKHCAGEVVEATEAYTQLEYVTNSDRTKTKKEAMEAGRRMSINQGTELIPHRKDGTIQNPNSHGNDPCPPRDKK